MAKTEKSKIRVFIKYYFFAENNITLTTTELDENCGKFVPSISIVKSGLTAMFESTTEPTARQWIVVRF